MEGNMIALVLSGAANFGAMQAGALEAILRTGIRPGMMIGTSAGALNAIALAADPTVDGAIDLQDKWSALVPEKIGVPRTFTALRHLVTRKDGLLSNEPLARHLVEVLPSYETYGELLAASGVHAYAVSVEMRTAALRVFGDNPEDRLHDGAMASTAVPPYLPPWQIGEDRYLDGGVYAKLPICAAFERGAAQVVAIDVTHSMGSWKAAHGVMGVSGYALSLLVEAQTAYEIAWSRQAGLPLRVFHLKAPEHIPFWDYSCGAELIRIGRELAERELEREPLRLEPEWRSALLRRFRTIPRSPICQQGRLRPGA
jgi:NTE family protein